MKIPFPALMTAIVVTVISIAGLCGQAPTSTSDSALLGRLYRATGLLYVQQADGSMHMDCTATAFERSGSDVYHIVTAAHCTSDDDGLHERVSVRHMAFYVTYDESGEKHFLRAKVESAGYQSRGDDFSVLEVKSERPMPVIPLGDESKEAPGSPIINIASPLGLGRQTFLGYITMLKLDRPLIEEEINWQGAMLLQINVGPGSSGSAVVSKQQEAIIGFVVGSVSRFGAGSPNVIAIPVSRFKQFRDKVAKGEYRWFVPRLSLPDDASQANGTEGHKGSVKTSSFSATKLDNIR